MKRTQRILPLVALIATLGLATSACGDDSSTDSGSDAKSGPKVGLAYDTGGEGDKSFNDSARAGAKKAEDELGATVKTLEPKTAEDRAKNLNLLVEDDSNPVIAVGFAFGDDLKKIAPANPKTTFAIVDSVVEADNVKSLVFAEEQGSYLVGAAAGLKTKTNKVGFVGGVHMDLIKKFEAGFAQGVKAVNPKAKVLVGYIQESDLKGFGDPEGGKQVANGQLDKGADVIYHAAGGSGAGVFAAVTEAGKGQWAIGVDSDQYLTAPADQQAHILTSMLKRVDVATFDMIKSVVDGAPLKSYSTFDLKADGVGYSTSGGFVDDIAAKLDMWSEKIKGGSLKVKTAP